MMAQKKHPTPMQDVLAKSYMPKLRAAQQRIRDGKVVATRENEGSEINGYTVFDHDDGTSTAVPRSSLEVRAKAWPSRLEGHTIPRELLPQDRMSAAQGRAHRKLVKEETNAILFGRPGRGKSMVALHALRDLHLMGFSVLGVSFSQFTRMCKPAWADAHKGENEEVVLSRLAAPTFLLLDDVGYGDSGYTPTDHDRKVFLELIGERDAYGRKTWITTNDSLEELVQYGEAAISRLRVRAIELDFNSLPNFRTEASQASML
jgi:hypothetical protein